MQIDVWQVLEEIRFLCDQGRVLAILSADTIVVRESGGVRTGKDPTMAKA